MIDRSGMAKISIKLIFIIICFGLIISGQGIAPQVFATSPSIASCATAEFNSTDLWQQITANQALTQVFNVTQDNDVLDAVGLRLKAAAPSPINISITQENSKQIIASLTPTVNSSLDKWDYFNFSDVALPKGRYWLNVSTTGANEIGWKYVSGASCVANNYILKGSETDKSDTLGFIVYAQNPDTHAVVNSNDSLKSQLIELLNGNWLLILLVLSFILLIAYLIHYEIKLRKIRQMNTQIN